VRKASYHLFAGSGFAEQQHGRLDGCNLRSLPQDFSPRNRFADDAPRPRSCVELVGQLSHPRLKLRRARIGLVCTLGSFDHVLAFQYQSQSVSNSPSSLDVAQLIGRSGSRQECHSGCELASETNPNSQD